MKEFIKLDYRKAVLTIIFFLVILLVSDALFSDTFGFFSFIALLSVYTIGLLIMNPFNHEETYINPELIIDMVLVVIASYLFSCLVVKIYDVCHKKVKKKK